MKHFYTQWLDRWDEKRAEQGNQVKSPSQFVLDAKTAFSGDHRLEIDIAEFCALANTVTVNASYFDRANSSEQNFKRIGDHLTFRSDIETETTENNTVYATISEGSSKRAVILFHHWNASKRQKLLATFLSRRGLTVVELALPYHFQRKRSSSAYADFMLSPNIGRTLRSFRQAVCDGRKLVDWLESQGYTRIGVLGISLGSWIAGLLAAHDTRVQKAGLLLSAGSLADFVWTGSATKTIRTSLEDHISLQQLRCAWKPLNLESYAQQLARPDLAISIVIAKRDSVVVPRLSENLASTLGNSGCNISVLKLNCGHYSLALPPNSIHSVLELERLLN